MVFALRVSASMHYINPLFLSLALFCLPCVYLSTSRAGAHHREGARSQGQGKDAGFLRRSSRQRQDRPSRDGRSGARSPRPWCAHAGTGELTLPASILLDGCMTCLFFGSSFRGPPPGSMRSLYTVSCLSRKCCPITQMNVPTAVLFWISLV